MTALQKFLEIHNVMLEENSYCYFELAYTRQTGWMTWVCSKPREDDPDRIVLAKGQGSTPEEAALNALATIGQTADAPLPRMVPLEDVRPVVEAANKVVEQHLGFETPQEHAFKKALSVFTTNHPLQ